MKRVISIILTAAILTGASVIPASAKTWVRVSSWAYNDVSNFKSEGLVPAAMDDVEDYTQNITRLQFAELLYSALTASDSESYFRMDNRFADTDSEAAAALCDQRIMMGEDADDEMIFSDETIVVSGGGVDPQTKFFPDRLLTREEMAAVLYRAAERYSPLFSDKEKTEPKDIADVSDWAKDCVSVMLGMGFLSGMDDGRFMPKNNLTIEQAVVAVYGLYKNIPTAPEADIEKPMSGGIIQSYSNGLTETKKDNMLYLKDGDNTLMEFETDIYANIYSVTVNDVIYAVAQKSSGNTDIYDAKTRKVLFSIPYPVSCAEEDYIITKSQNIGPMTFGLYDYNGKEILAPKYSYEEIETLKANDFKIPEDKYQAASGWIYYKDMDDKGSLYRIDSNGENKQKLGNDTVWNFEYLRGHIYYTVRPDTDKPQKLYRMKPDGTDVQLISENNGYWITCYYQEFTPESDNFDGLYNRSIYPGDTRYASDSEWVYYSESGKNTSSLWRVSVSDGELKKEKLSGDLYVRNEQFRDGKMYMTDYTKARENIEKLEAEGDDESWLNADISESLYVWEDGELTKLADGVMEYGFSGDKLVLRKGINYNENEFTTYIADLDGGNCEVWQEVEDAKAEFNTKYDENGVEVSDTGSRVYEYENASDENYTVYEKIEWTRRDADGNRDYIYKLCVKDADGKETVISSERRYGMLARSGDILFYQLDNENDSRGAKSIYTYNLVTDETKKVADDVRRIEYSGQMMPNDNGWLTYSDFSFNVWRYDSETDTKTEVFPNASLKRYGKVAAMRGLNTGMYKIDEDGNYSFLMDDLAASCLYVENGAYEGTHF